ncbi:MAG: hypothetical protein Nk1A_5800 [Endomicrobiia bacterium]|nr:MAG: hypothetical protein Nk1A_5800 [Endomicrobiia bacterium]
MNKMCKFGFVLLCGMFLLSSFAYANAVPTPPTPSPTPIQTPAVIPKREPLRAAAKGCSHQRCPIEL